MKDHEVWAKRYDIQRGDAKTAFEDAATSDFAKQYWAPVLESIRADRETYGKTMLLQDKDIVRMRKQIMTLRAALTEITKHPKDGTYPSHATVRGLADIARKALAARPTP